MITLYRGNLSAFERQYYAASFARQQALYLGYFAQHRLELAEKLGSVTG
jgi:hypothetical protein